MTISPCPSPSNGHAKFYPKKSPLKLDSYRILKQRALSGWSYPLRLPVISPDIGVKGVPTRIEFMRKRKSIQVPCEPRCVFPLPACYLPVILLMVSKKMLVVDDDQLIGWALEKGLSADNLQLSVVETGRDALTEMEKARYNLVLLDIHLPDVNGLELLGEIRRRSPDSRVIVTSADITDSNRERALSGGALQFLEKPFTITAIQDILRSTLGDFSVKRKHARYLCNFPLSVGVAVPCPGDDPYGAFPVQGIAVDVGTSGVRLSIDQPLAVGQELCLSPAADDGTFEKFIPPRTRARVVWVAPGASGFLAGLKFAS